jgi:hypothetical protein
VWSSICDTIVKSIIAIQPILAHAYGQCQLRPTTTEEAADLPFRCFELLGYDFLLDASGRPWLLEVNHSPSFSVDTPLDREVKEPLIRDTLQLARLDPRAVAKAQTVRAPPIGSLLPSRVALRKHHRPSEMLGQSTGKMPSSSAPEERKIPSHCQSFKPYFQRFGLN